ncbi:MAG: putative protein-tyrosine-phosphatase MKP1 [Streblomastix strix]|uniref:Uncharacterized protein n=1 Tax=Streblomastix strix TaxID=222440 RepID=A0A5J4WXM8_9EUKA|nr:MAG: putative protein-tyrosine-phosphatase MKP1 [Streblomastix strix]
MTKNQFTVPKLFLDAASNSKAGRPPDEVEEERRRAELSEFEEQLSEIVTDFLYLGSIKVAANHELLKQNKITHIINCTGDEGRAVANPSLFNYLDIYLSDSPNEDIVPRFPFIVAYVDNILNSHNEQKPRFLFHCMQGVSRSASMLMAYLMYKNQWTYEQTLQYVQDRRRIVSPNIGFAAQLKIWEQTVSNQKQEEHPEPTVTPLTSQFTSNEQQQSSNPTLNQNDIINKNTNEINQTHIINKNSQNINTSTPIKQVIVNNAPFEDDMGFDQQFQLTNDSFYDELDVESAYDLLFTSTTPPPIDIEQQLQYIDNINIEINNKAKQDINSKSQDISNNSNQNNTQNIGIQKDKQNSNIKQVGSNTAIPLLIPRVPQTVTFSLLQNNDSDKIEQSERQSDSTSRQDGDITSSRLDISNSNRGDQSTSQRGNRNGRRRRKRNRNKTNQQNIDGDTIHNDENIELDKKDNNIENNIVKHGDSSHRSVKSSHRSHRSDRSSHKMRFQTLEQRVAGDKGKIEGQGGRIEEDIIDDDSDLGGWSSCGDSGFGDSDISNESGDDQKGQIKDDNDASRKQRHNSGITQGGSDSYSER